MDGTQIGQLAAALASNRFISSVLQRWPEVDLPNGWLAAGAIAQTVWNIAHRRAPEADIKDVDLAYFDADDLSAESELGNEARIRCLFSALGVAIDVKNEARVHIWYEAKFGSPIPPYRSVEEAIATFPTTATAIGVRPQGSRLEGQGPFGLDDLLGLVVRPNKAQITQAIYEAKVARWRSCWPNLKICGWDETPT
jgi:hypothetical protein